MSQAAREEEPRQRLVAVQGRIAAAAKRAGRDPSEVQLVVVTKGHPVGRLHALLESGQRRLGENRVEEALPKIDALGELPGLTWHLVGPLQSRKVPLVGDRFDLLHAVDRLKVARLLDARSGEIGRRQAILLEWNVSGEPTKAGWQVEEGQAGESVLQEIREVVGLPHLEVRGLMTMAPQTGDVAIQRTAFRRLAELRRRLRDRLGWGPPGPAMGRAGGF